MSQQHERPAMKRRCAIRSLFLVRKTQEFVDDFGGAARVNGRNSTPVDERDTIGRLSFRQNPNRTARNGRKLRKPLNRDLRALCDTRFPSASWLGFGGGVC
jgi:hypothetical protein